MSKLESNFLTKKKKTFCVKKKWRKCKVRMQHEKLRKQWDQGDIVCTLCPLSAGNSRITHQINQLIAQIYQATEEPFESTNHLYAPHNG